MVQLIITLFAIALTAAVVAATIKYIPWWYKTAADTEIVVRDSARALDAAFSLKVIDDNGVVPTPIMAEDGGLSAYFSDYYQFTPAAPANFIWVYGKRIGDDAPYFCLKAVNASVSSEGVARGMRRAMAVFSEEQVFLNTTCGASSNMPLPNSSEYPVDIALTVLVRPTPILYD